MATQSEIAEHLDLSERWVRNLLQDGILPASKGRGGYDIDACRMAYIRYIRAQVSGQARRPESVDSEGDISDLEQKKLEEDYLWTKERRIAQQLKNEIAARQQLPAEFATFALTKISAEVATILDTLPLTMRRKHPDLEARHLNTLTRELSKARNQAASLGSTLPDILDDYLRTHQPAN